MSIQTPDSFTIRVYGLLIHNDQLLLSREVIQGEIYTKFPGGGLEFGEGVMDCLHREFMEEASIELSKPELFHINENFVASAFHQSKQVITIYYKVWSNQTQEIHTSGTEEVPGADKPLSLFWKPLRDLSENDLDLPTDKQVVAKLLYS